MPVAQNVRTSRSEPYNRLWSKHQLGYDKKEGNGFMYDNMKNQTIADDQKASGITPDTGLTPAGENKKKIRKAPKVKKPQKKGLPIAVDILIVFALLAVIFGAAFGIKALTEYFSTQYAQRQIMYTVLAEDVKAEIALDEDGDCVVLPDSEVYLAQGDQNSPVGRVISVSVKNNDDGTVDIYTVVRVTADYNYKLGYFVDQTKIAVGKAYTYRFSGLVSDAVIVTLQTTEGGS